MTETVDSLQDDLAYLRRMTEAGRRGPPLGGLLLTAFGGYIGFSALIQWAYAFQLLPRAAPLPDMIVAFIVFSLVALSNPAPSRRRVLVAFAASLVAGMAFSLISNAVIPNVGDLARSGQLTKADIEVFARYAPLFLIVGPLVMLALGAWLIFQLRRHAASLSGPNRIAGAAWISGFGVLFVTLVVFTIWGFRSHNWFMLMSLPAVFWVVWGGCWLATGLGGGARWTYLAAGGSWLLAIACAATSDVFLTSVIGLLGLSLLPGWIMLREARRAEAA